MKSKSFINEFFSIRKATKMTREEILELQKERFDTLVAYAREYSPFYRELYHGLESNPSMDSLPLTNKTMLMGQFDGWLTDSELSLAKVDDFLDKPENIGKFLDNKCIVAMTSGTLGTPTKILIDKKTWNVMNAIHYSRLFSLTDLIKVGMKGGKYFTISNPGFSATYNTYRNQVLPNNFNKYRCKAVDVDTPTSEIVTELNKFKPSVFSAYPTTMQLLLPHIKSGSLRINPDIIVLGGETCPPELKKELDASFKSKIQNAYACTEAGMITTPCSEGHLHINLDWVILEPVDENNKPVPNGIMSHKVLLTNLSNFLQPIIKYEVADKIIIYDEPCKCGSVMPYLYVEGRTNDILDFQGAQGIVNISPMALATLGKIKGIVRYQIVQKNYHRLELKLQSQMGFDRAELFAQAQKQLLSSLKKMGIENVQVYLSEEIPKTHPTSGKFQYVIKDMELS